MSDTATRSGLFGDILFRAASDVLNAVIGLAIIALVARQLSASDYGIYTQTMTTASLLLPLLTLRLNTACVRFFPSIATGDSARKQHFTTASLGVLALAAMARRSSFSIVPNRRLRASVQFARCSPTASRTATGRRSTVPIPHARQCRDALARYDSSGMEGLLRASSY